MRRPFTIGAGRRLWESGYEKGNCFFNEEFAVFDGPGIRTTVFFKGCPMRCSWCHNPEGLSAKPQLIRNPNGCLRCGRCEKCLQKRFPPSPTRISRCALKSSCAFRERNTPPGELADLLLKNEDILRMNEGGVTFSGGECLMQTEFLLETLRFLDGRLHTAIETGGCVDPADFQRAVEKNRLCLFRFENQKRRKGASIYGAGHPPDRSQFRDFEKERQAIRRADAFDPFGDGYCGELCACCRKSKRERRFEGRASSLQWICRQQVCVDRRKVLARLR